MELIIAPGPVSAGASKHSYNHYHSGESSSLIPRASAHLLATVQSSAVHNDTPLLPPAAAGQAATSNDFVKRKDYTGRCVRYCDEDKLSLTGRHLTL